MSLVILGVFLVLMVVVCIFLYFFGSWCDVSSTFCGVVTSFGGLIVLRADVKRICVRFNSYWIFIGLVLIL